MKKIDKDEKKVLIVYFIMALIILVLLLLGLFDKISPVVSNFIDNLFY